MAELIQKDIIDLQDIEKVQSLQALMADPTQYQQFLTDKSGQVMTEVIDTKRASFVKTAGDMARQFDMDHNSLATLARSNDLATMQDHIITEQNAEEGAKKSNEDLTRRQVEINNWYYENKRETLFTLQLVLLTMLTVTIFLALANMGFVSKDGSDYLMLFVIVVAAGTWLYRWYYTRYIRDGRYWSRRSFQEDGKYKSPRHELCLTEGGQ